MAGYLAVAVPIGIPVTYMQGVTDPRRGRSQVDVAAAVIRGVILYLFVGADAPTILIYAPSILDMHPQ